MKTNQNNQTTPSELSSADNSQAGYYVILPDGIPLTTERFPNLTAARIFLSEWCEQVGIDYCPSSDEMPSCLDIVPASYFK